MEDIVALSNRLRNRQSTSSVIALDAIPPLIRALPQVHAETNRLPHLQSHNAAALRLFSNLGFEVDKLRHAVSRLDSTSFTEAAHVPEAPFRRPDWLAQNALEESRICLNTDLRQISAQEFHKETREASNRLLDKLRSLPIPEALTAIHTPFSVKTRTTTKSPYTPASPATTGVASTHLPYLAAIKAIAQNGDAPSAPSLMHETAVTVGDDGHFVECLAILASVSRYSPPGEPAWPDLVVWGTRVVLEDQFAECIPGLPSKPRMARPAAIIPPIVDFVKHKHTDFLADNIAWATAFYCMRVGHVKAALQVLQDAHLPAEEHTKCFNCLERFVEGGVAIAEAFLKKSRVIQEQGPRINEQHNAECHIPMTPGCLFSEEDHRDLAEEYQRVAWHSRKPFIRLVYVLIARLELLQCFGPATDALPSNLELSKHPTPGKHEEHSLALPEEDVAELLPSVEDYMWFRLWLCRTPAESQMLSVLRNSNFVTQAQIQEDISAYGSAHFDPDGEQPLVYAFVLIASGMYENAFSFLFSHSDERCMQYAIHFAIVLYHLNWMKDEDVFHRQLMEFVTLFSSLYPVEAALYLMILKNAQVLQNCLRELVVSTGEYESLLGRVGLDLESDEPGALAELLTSSSVPLPSSFTQKHLQSVRAEAALYGAVSAASKNEYATASELYSLAGEPVKSIEMVMHNLAEEVHRLSSSGRSLAVAEAKNALKVMNRSSADIPEKVSESLKELVEISKVFEEYWTGRYGRAWDALRRLRILPLTAEGVSESHRPATVVDGRFDPCVGKCLLELLKVGLHIAEYALENDSVACDLEKAMEKASEEYKNEPRIPDASEVKSLCIFAGILGVTDTTVNERLIRIELLLTSVNRDVRV
ncbi:Nuclear pore complex protein Nup93 [Gracilariopsis chorda]|uniref:Nuclear pore protein n=1 Tax=Gracilariopsis chorda TaxID=448386 RepID=A0A2V3IP51_9FLOR|nr:Nuclear pore complex protein Nup93 [Gracilariopsis chorda]|eukprot:PXF43865.1 Nuclear pore complex protein Nup93 [Gracilariopsis chorda]